MLKDSSFSLAENQLNLSTELNRYLDLFYLCFYRFLIRVNFMYRLDIAIIMR